MSAEVFVSYSSQDRDRVMPVVQHIRKSGISVWVDEGNIHAADLWSEQIVQAIADSRIMVVMLSEKSTDSHNVIKEVMLSSEQKKILLPVYLEPAEIPAKLQYQLAGIQHLELYGQHGEQALNDLITGLKKRGASGNTDFNQQPSTSIKRHETPRPKTTTPKPAANIFSIAGWILSVLLIVLLGLLLSKNQFIGGAKKLSKNQTKELGSIHLKIPIPEEYPIASPTDMPFGAPMRKLAISPNGENLVYVCIKNKARYLCLRSLSDDNFLLLSGSKGAVLPFFSPDGKWIGFLTEKKVKKIELSSGFLTEVCNAKNPYAGATWSKDGMIYFGDSEGFKFLKVSENGGEPEFVSEKINRIINPNAVPNGKNIVFDSPGISVTRAPFSVHYISSSIDDPKKLINGRIPSWIGENKLITLEDNQLRLTEVNMETLLPIEKTKTILKAKIKNDIVGGQYSISQNNILAFLKGEKNEEMHLALLDPISGKSELLSDRKQQYGQFSISPSGQKLAIEIINNQMYSINIFDTKRGRFSSFSNSNHNYAPFWADESKLYYTSNRTDPSEFELYMYDFEKQKEVKVPLDGEIMVGLDVSDISSKGDKLFCNGHQIGKRTDDLYYVDLIDKKKFQLTKNDLQEWGAVLSKDEKWLAYTSEKDMEGSFAIYLNRFPEMNQEIRISSGGGEEPKWLPDGSGIYYRNGSQWMKVKLSLNGQPEIGEPELFFEGDYLNVWGPSHDIFPNGKVLLLKGEKWIPPTEIDVIVNVLNSAL